MSAVALKPCRKTVSKLSGYVVTFPFAVVLSFSAFVESVSAVSSNGGTTVNYTVFYPLFSSKILVMKIQQKIMFICFKFELGNDKIRKLGSTKRRKHG